jgi:hypothetical protein
LQELPLALFREPFALIAMNAHLPPHRAFFSAFAAAMRQRQDPQRMAQASRNQAESAEGCQGAFALPSLKASAWTWP